MLSSFETSSIFLEEVSLNESIISSSKSSNLIELKNISSSICFFDIFFKISLHLFVWLINKSISFQDGDRFISIKPSTVNLDIDFELKYENEFIGNQRNSVKVYEDDLTDIFNSRTFCLHEDIESIKKIGLAKGGSLDNAVVVKDKEILTQEGLRNKKEFVNHKILDCIGDLYTCGYRMIASIQCSKGGHYLTNQLLRKVFENKENFSIVEIKEKNLPHTLINKNFLRSIA